MACTLCKLTSTISAESHCVSYTVAYMVSVDMVWVSSYAFGIIRICETICFFP